MPRPMPCSQQEGHLGDGHLDGKMGGTTGLTPRHYWSFSWWRGRVWLDGLHSLCPFASALSLPCAATQLVTMHDLKQGLGPSGIAGPRKLASNKYKLKVGVPEPQEGSPLAGAEAVGRAGGLALWVTVGRAWLRQSSARPAVDLPEIE